MTLGPTLAIEECADRAWDVIVIGAGPAGSLAARGLARRGLSVLVVDRAAFPRSKVCGCCLNGRALRALAAAGLGDVPARLGVVPLRGMRLAADGRLACIRLSTNAAISRTALDAALVGAAIDAGAAFLPGVQGTIGPCNDARRVVRLTAGGHRIETAARVVVAANGLGSRLLAPEVQAIRQGRSRVGAGTVLDCAAGYPSGCIFMACDLGGYVGLVRLEDGRLDVAAALDTHHVRGCGGPGPAAAVVLEKAGLPPVPGLLRAAWRGTPLLTCRLARPAGRRVLAVGDAAGYVEPFTGEGIAWALTTGSAVVPLAVQACRRWDTALACRWSACYHHAIGQRQRTCRIVTSALRHPLLTRTAVGLLHRLPGLAAPLLYRLNR